MILETYYTLSEAFNLIGRHLHGDAWTGDESNTGYCSLTEDDITTLRARAEKAIEPTRFLGGGEPDSASEDFVHLLALARDEQTEPINIIRLVVWKEMSAGKGPKMPPEGPPKPKMLPGMSAETFAAISAEMLKEFNVLLLSLHAQSRLDELLSAARFESLKRLRSGDTLSEAHFAILGELQKEYDAKERREKVMLWITLHTWSGDDTETALTGYIHTPEDGKTIPILAHCWDARSFHLSLYNNKATMDDQPWPADGVLVFLRSQLDAVLRGEQVALPMALTSAGTAEPTPSAVIADDASSGGRPTLKTEIDVAYKEVRDAGDINFNAPKIEFYELIREKVRRYKGDQNLQRGLGNEAIRQVVSPLFEADKNKRLVSP